MKLNEIKSVVSSNLQGHNFSMEVNAQAFEILSKNLYAYPLNAMVRELACNAIDSHKQAGKENLPIEIKLPTIIDNIFSVIDYGVGLSDEQMHNVYSSFFTSTKNNDNELIGGFGLGSKTPLAVTDSFTVISYYDGTKTTYIVSKKDGIPSINKICSAPTERVNGLEVNVPISEENMTEIRDACDKEFRWFKVSPKCVNTNGQFITNHLVEPLYRDGYVSDPESRSSLQVVIGGVAYDVNTYRVDQIVPVSCSLTITMDIGSVSLTPSREMLNYDDKTILALKNAVHETINKVKTDVRAMLVKGNIYDVARKFGNLLNLLGETSFDRHSNIPEKFRFIEIFNSSDKYSRDITNLSLVRATIRQRPTFVIFIQGAYKMALKQHSKYRRNANFWCIHDKEQYEFIKRLLKDNNNVSFYDSTEEAWKAFGIEIKPRPANKRLKNLIKLRNGNTVEQSSIRFAIAPISLHSHERNKFNRLNHLFKQLENEKCFELHGTQVSKAEKCGIKVFTQLHDFRQFIEGVVQVKMQELKKLPPEVILASTINHHNHFSQMGVETQWIHVRKVSKEVFKRLEFTNNVDPAFEAIIQSQFANTQEIHELVINAVRELGILERWPHLKLVSSYMLDEQVEIVNSLLV